MAGVHGNGTMPKSGHVTDLREQWLVRTDGALAHRLQDREISSHLCENRCRNQQIREDFPVALSEQQLLEREECERARLRAAARRRQADGDAELAREMAELHMRRRALPGPSRALPEPAHPAPSPLVHPAPPLPSPPHPGPARPRKLDVNPEELGLSPAELEDMRRRLEQEERDARLARELSNEVEGQDALMADMRYAVEAQDSELARLLQEREYKKLQKAKEKAKQKALLKKQQRLAAQQELQPPQATLLDAYSSPQDLIREHSGLRLCKSVDSDLNYVEPFEKEHIQSKASALQSKELSSQYYGRPEPSHSQSQDALDSIGSYLGAHQRAPPPPPLAGKKPRFPDPVSIRPASHYSSSSQDIASVPHSYSENNNVYNSYTNDGSMTSQSRSSQDRADPSKRLSVTSAITPEALAKKNKQADLQKKRKGCKIQ